MSDDFDPTSLVPKDQAPEPTKTVSLFKRDTVDDSAAGRGELAGSTDDAPDADDDTDEAPAPKARRATLVPDDSAGDRARETSAVRKARESAATAKPPADEDDEDDGPAAKPKPAAEETDAEFVANLRKREQAEKWRLEAQQRASGEAAQIIAQAKEEAARLFEDARKRAAEDARKEVLERLRTRPGDALREWEVPADQFLRDIADAHTPEGQQRRLLAKQQAEIDALRAAIDQRTKQETDATKAAEQQRVAQSRASVETEFLQAVTADSAPGARMLHGSDAAIMREAYDVLSARRTRGESCANADIIAELERNAQERLGALRQTLGVSPGAAAPAGRATGPRTLSAGASGERRSSPKPTSEMTEDELEKHEAEVVRSAREKALKRKAKAASA